MIGATDRPLDAEEQSAFERYRRTGLSMLGAAETDAPKALVRAVNEYVDAWQGKRRSIFARLRSRPEDSTEVARALSVVWGDQIVRRFGWEWICKIQNGEERYVVASLDRSLAIHAPEFINQCFENPSMDCTALLAFNMQEAGHFTACAPREYVSVMSGVRRIVPKR